MTHEPTAGNWLGRPVPRGEAVGAIVAVAVWGAGMLAMMLLSDYAGVSMPQWVWIAWYVLCIGVGMGAWPRLQRRQRVGK